MKSILIKFFFTIFLLTNILLPCAVCYGNPESLMSQGMNMGVLTLVGFISFVLIMIPLSIFILFNKSRKINK